MFVNLLLAAALSATLLGSAEPNVPFRYLVVDRDPPGRPHCKTVGDLNGDALPDILAASDMGGGLFWYAAPNWTKRRIDTGAFTTDMQAADIDGDGDLDIVIPKTGTGLVWYENPAWVVRVIDPGPAHDVETGDINRDGILDVVTRMRDTAVFLQRPRGVWTRIDIQTGGRGGTALGDIDRDGDLDIAQNGYWLEAPRDLVKGVWKRHKIAEGWPDDCGVLVADVNRDGRADVLLAPAETKGRLSWYEAADPRGGGWTEHVIADGVSHIHTFKSADVNRDGQPDIITAEMEQSPLGRVTVHYNLGKGLKWSPRVVGLEGSHNIRAADLGNDGDIDLVGANHGNHGGPTPVGIWENLANRPAPALPLDRWRRHVIDADRPWRAVFISHADLDGDALPDVVTGGWWYPNPGRAGGQWKRKAIGEGFPNFALAYDFDRDGDIDLLGTAGKGSERNPDLVLAYNDGRGNFTIYRDLPKPDGDFLQGVAVLRRSPNGPIQAALSYHRRGKGIQALTFARDPRTPPALSRISDTAQDEELSAGDIGRDVHPDLLMGTKWLRSDGKTWTVHELHPAAGRPDRNRLADINHDGRLDAVVGFEAVNAPGKLVWYEQPADPTKTWTEHGIAVVTGPMSLDVADVDRDGDLDVVVGEHNYEAPETAKLHIFENLDGRGREWRDRTVHTGDEHHDGAQLVDIDHDGDLDILSIGWSHARVLLYENLAIDPAGQGRFVRRYWYERGVEHGNPGAAPHFRVNAPEVSLDPRYRDRAAVKGSGMMQIAMPEKLHLLEAAELYLETWGGHPGTENKRVTVNGRTTYPFPESGAARGYNTHQYPVLPLRLTDLVNGYNALQFACGKGRTFWGQFIIEQACLRAVLGRGHPDLKKAGLDGFDARVEVRAAGAERFALSLAVEEKWRSAIARVEYQGYYTGYDESGSLSPTGWHGFTKNRQPVAFLEENWDTSLLPAQEGAAVRAVVHFKTPGSLAFETAPSAPVAIGGQRSHGVKLLYCDEVPSRFHSRAKRKTGCTLTLDLEPARIERAMLHVVLWDGGRGTVKDYFTLNGRGLPVAGEGRHDVIYSRLEVDPGLLRAGANRFELLSDTEEHGLEALLPGPALAVRYRK